jgi:membrane protease YdiL (CAAX protease family)
LAYVVLVFAVSWGAWWVAALGGGEWTSFPTVLLFALGGAGPLVATGVLVCTTLAADRRRAFARRVVDPRPVANRWLLVIVALTVGPALAGQWLAAAAGDDGAWRGVEWPGLAAFAGIVAFNLVASLAEEPGWRGYAYDRARGLVSPRAASLLVGGIWLLWHVPLYFVEGTFQNGHGFLSQGFFAYSLALFPTAVIFGWVVARTGFSVFAAVLLHLVDNVAGEVLGLSVAAEAGRALVLTVVALIVWRAWKPGEPHPPEGRVIASGTHQASNSSPLT